MKNIVIAVCLAVFASSCAKGDIVAPNTPPPSQQGQYPQGGGPGRIPGPSEVPGAGISALQWMYNVPLGTSISVELRDRPSGNVATGWIYPTGYIAAPITAPCTYNGTTSTWYPNKVYVGTVELVDPANPYGKRQITLP